MEDLLWQNSILYEILRQGFAVMFYILLVAYILYKIYAMYICQKLNCKEEYKLKKKEILAEIKENRRKYFKKNFNNFSSISYNIYYFGYRSIFYKYCFNDIYRIWYSIRILQYT